MLKQPVGPYIILHVILFLPLYIAQANFYGSTASTLSSAAKPSPGGVYSAPTPPSAHGGAVASGGGHGSSSHGSPGTGASKPLYGAQQSGVSSGSGVSGTGGPGGMGGMQQGGQPQQVG